MALLFIWTLKKKPALHWIFIWLGKPCKTLGTCSATCQLPQRKNDLRRGEWEMWKIVSVLKHILWEQVQAKKQSEGERNPVQPQAQGKGAALHQAIFSLCHEVNWSCLKRGEKEWKNELNPLQKCNPVPCHGLWPLLMAYLYLKGQKLERIWKLQCPGQHQKIILENFLLCNSSPARGINSLSTVPAPKRH